MASQSRFSSWHTLMTLGTFAAAVALTLISLRESQREQVPPDNRPIQLPTGNYVTSNSCRACHLGNYASWHTSFHRTMTQVASSTTLLDPNPERELLLADRQYKIERKGDKFLVRTRVLGGDYGPARQVVLLTGSHYLQVPWIATGDGRTLEQLPFAYIIGEKMWAPVSQTFLMPPDVKEYYSTGAWNGGCMDCHVTHGQSRFVEGFKWDTRVTEFGIACEACHSEGREHIALNRDPVRRFKLHLTTQSDASIRNPARLSAPASGLDCGQCHSIWAFKDMPEKIDFNREGPRFRPGHEDLAQRFVVQPNTSDHSEQKDFIRKTEPGFFENRFWDDGMIRVTGREFNGVQASPCFRGGNFSCITCHEMHPANTEQTNLVKWARSAQLRPMMDSDEACLQCHKPFAPNIPAHTHHSAASPGSRCYNCHMPNTSFGLLHAMRSHQVSSPSIRESLDYGRPNACNLCHLNQTLAWAADKLHTWYNQTIPELSADDQSIAAGVQWLVKGDAGQRALIAWGMGWPPAQQAAGREWLYPYLIYTMADPYAAVRFDAWKSLQTLPGFAGFSFIYTADERTLRETAGGALAKWLREVRSTTTSFEPQTGLEPDGRLKREVFERLRDERDNKRIFLAE